MPDLPILILIQLSFQVVMITSSAQKVKTGEKVSHTFYQVPYKKGFLEDTLLRLQLEGHPIQSFSLLPEVFSNFCEGSLNSTEVTNNLKDVDLLVHDCLAVCAVLLGEKYDIPRVEIVPITPNSPAGFMHMIPMPVSYVPQLLTGLTDKMSFLERVVNLGAYIGFMVAINLGFGIPMNALKSKYNIKPERSFPEAVADAELCIITADFAMEYPQPLLPGMNDDRGRLLDLIFKIRVRLGVVKLTGQHIVNQQPIC